MIGYFVLKVEATKEGSLMFSSQLGKHSNRRAD